jgi:serine phosphatase RsbU (regulator of sigma subunit)
VIIQEQKKVVEEQKLIVETHQKEVVDSINYAKRIQYALLAHEDLLESNLNSHFVLFKPKDIVSGDFYWAAEHDDNFYLAVCDSTGHGVPGAFMSLISSSILNESIDENISHYSPAKMLEFLRREINIRLSQNTTDQINDGLDISLICYSKDKGTIEYVNANRPLYIISNDELITLTSENVNIGGYTDFDSVITTKTLSIKKDDLLFLFTDGITDQFGGERNKKYNPARLRKFLLMNNHLSLPELKQRLVKEIAEWQGSCEQTDDILLIGLKV